MKKSEKYLIGGLIAIIAVIGSYLLARKWGWLPPSLDVLGNDSRSLDLTNPNMSGSDVKELQTILTELYAKAAIEAGPGPIDGFYGPLTKISHNQALNVYGITDRSVKALSKVIA